MRRDRALWKVLLAGVLVLLPGCKYIYGTAYPYLTVKHPQTGTDADLLIQVVQPPPGSPTLDNGRYPALIFIHGGGWSAGNRFDNGLDLEIKAAADKGFVATSIDYRLVAKTTDKQAVFPWPAQIQDVKCAIRWLKTQASRFNIDPNRIVLMGVSAGGHLAAMAAETPGEYALEAAECPHAASSDVAAAIAFSGVVDVETTWNRSRLVALQLLGLAGTGAPYTAGFSQLDSLTRDALLGADPVSSIGHSAAPVLLIHPQDDFVVPEENARRYFHALLDQGRAACLLLLDRGGHFTDTDGADAMQYARMQMYQWLDWQFKGAPSQTPCSAYPDTEHALTVPRYP